MILSTALSVCIRKEMAFMMLPIAGSVFWFKNRNHGNWKCWKNWIPVAVVFSVFSALLLLDVLAYQSQGWKEYRQFNAARTGIFDYYDFPSYEENKDFYDSIGIDETIETAMEEYSLILDDRINTETFLAIEQQGKTLWNNRSFMQRAGETLRIFLQNWFSFEYFPLNYIVMLVGSSLLFIMLKQKDRVVLYWYCIAWLVIDCLWIYLCYRGRFPARIGYSMHIFAFMMEMSFLWILHKEGCLVISKVFWRGALVCILLCSIYQGTTTYQYSHNAHQKNKSYRTVLKYCEDRNTNFYFMDVFSFSLYTDNFQLFLPSNEKNYMRFGDWMSYSPLYYEKLSHNDIHKIAEDLIHRDDIYLITRDDVDIQYLKRYMKSLNPKYTYHVADVIQEDGFLFYVYKWFEADSSQAELSSERISEIIASSDTASCSNVIDDNIATGWYCDSQIEGEEVVIRLKERETITGVRLDVTDYADSPKNLKIYTSLDGNVWSEQEIENQLNMTFRFSPAECNYVKLQLGDGEDYVQWRWSIQELTLLGVEVYE